MQNVFDGQPRMKQREYISINQTQAISYSSGQYNNEDNAPLRGL